MNPPFAKNLTCLWRGHWTDRANMLEVGVSKLGEIESVADISPGRGPRIIHEEMKRPIGDAYEKRHNSDYKALYAWCWLSFYRQCRQ